MQGPCAVPPRPRRERTAWRWLTGLLVLALPVLWAGNCGSRSEPPPVPLVTVTVNAVPDALNDLLVVPPSGFTVDLAFPDPGSVVPGSLRVQIIPFTDDPAVEVTGDLVVDEPDRAVVLVSPANALPVGTHRIKAWVSAVGGGTSGATYFMAVRNFAPGGPPLAGGQWVQLDFSADPDGDGDPDLPGDLDAMGLLAADPGLADTVRSWVEGEVVARTQAFFDAPNPSGLPGGDAADIVFDAGPPGAGPYTRICVGGADPSGQGVIGNLMFDPGNSNKSDVACDTFTPSGVFPRAMQGYSGSQAYQDAFGPVMAVPVGTHPLDPVVLGPGYDPGDPDQLARFEAIETAVEVFAQAVATVTAHELGHAIGLVPRGEPGGGLYGGTGGAQDTHNVTPSGTTPYENLLMNQGASFSFAELVGWGSAPLPRLRELNHAYLRGRLVLDPQVTGLYLPPVLDACGPSPVSYSGPTVLTFTCVGQNFLATPAIRLEGPVSLELFSETLVSSEEVTALLSVLQLIPGLYDVELRNGDGQEVVLEGGLEVVP